MRQYPLENTRNIGIMAHIDAGKTTTSERILFFTGKTRKMGEVHDGTAVMDSMAQEQERGITIMSAATTVQWTSRCNGKDYRINIIDTPGHVDFTVEVERSLRILDGAVAVFCAKGGVEPQSETVWHQASKYNVPRIAFVNKMDINGANFENVVDMMRVRLKTNAMPIQMPIGKADSFVGIVDCITQQAYYYKDALGSDIEVTDIPKDLVVQAKHYRAQIEELVAGRDDVLTEKFLNGESLTVDEIKQGIRSATLANALTPVLCGSAYKNKGVQLLLDAICDYLPSPSDVGAVKGYSPKSDKVVVRQPDDDEPLCAIAFKILADPFVGRLTFVRLYSGSIQIGTYVYNSSQNKRERISKILQMHSNQRKEVDSAHTGEIVAVVGLRDTVTGDTICNDKEPIVLETMTFPEPVIKVAIEPKTKQGSERMTDALIKLAEEDPTFKTYTDKETSQIIIAGMGELHLEIIVDRLLREFKVEANVGKPQVSYRETITAQSVADYKYSHQSGGRGQFARVKLAIEPLEKGSGFEFVDQVVGGNIPKEYIPAVQQGIKEAARAGIVAGYEVVDFRATVLDGTFHPVDSSELAFKICGSLAFRQAAESARPILLEPLMKVEITLPDEYLGDVMGNISARRGSITGIEMRLGMQVINALIPLSEMFGYATDLRSKTQGRGNYTMQFDTFVQVSEAVRKKLLG
ncbi:MAG: elongation factor G [Clostridia bacterium]